MINTLYGIKKGMAQGYDARGRRVGVTMVSIEPNVVTQKKTLETKDGYNSLQLGISEKKNIKKPQLGILKKSNIERQVRWFREVKTENSESLEPGQEVSLNQVFSKGDEVKVTGISKGKGFQGGVRRHGFHGGPKTHGQSDRHRAPGSIGAGTTPGRVYKGKKMAGHMGNETVSTRGLEVIAIDKANNLITIKGAVPGPVGALVRVEKLGRIKGYIAPPEEKEEDEIESDVEQMEQGGGTIEEGTEATNATEETKVEEVSDEILNQVQDDVKDKGEDENGS